MRHSQRTSPAVAALLLALGADARVGLDQSILGAPNNILFPDALTSTVSATVMKWGNAGGNSQKVTGGINITAQATASAPTTFTTQAAYADSQGSCVDCIRSQQVWCSRYYMAEKDTAFTAAVVFKAFASGTQDATIGTASITSASAVDLGSCCYNISDITGTVATDIDFQNDLMCPARFTNDGGDDTFIDNATTGAPGTAVALAELGNVGAAADLNWWCSDGQMSRDSNTSTTVFASPVVLAVADTAADNTNLYDSDPRTEFWLISCRQNVVTCGAALVTTPATLIDASLKIFASGSTINDKCTWIMKTGGTGQAKGAPTFTTTHATAVLSDKWVIHYVEYNIADGTENTITANKPTVLTKDTTVANANILFDVAASASWGEIKGRLYDPAAYSQLQEQPFVWQWAQPGVWGASSDAGYDKKRWFPVALAEAEIAAYEVQKEAYASAKAAYDALKTAYEKVYNDNAAAKEAATLFKAAVLVAIPLRPCTPTDLPAYAGKRLAKWAATKDYAWAGAVPASMREAAAVGGVSPGVLANDFVVDGEYGGGWGAWTMGLLTLTKDVSKSFGIYGQQAAAPATETPKFPGYFPLDRSYNQQQLNMCNENGIGAAGFCTSASTVSLSSTVLIVSVWAGDAGGEALTASVGLSIQFKLSAWADHSADWAAPAAPTPYATDPKAFDGAKALAVSAAAAAAVASALY